MSHIKIADGVAEVDASLYWDEPAKTIWRGRSESLSDESDVQVAKMARWAMTIQARSGPVAIVGLGVGVLPRLLANKDLTIYEKEQSVTDLFVAANPLLRANFLGEWTGRFDRKYGAIAIDHGYEFDEAAVREFLLPDGIILS